MITGMTTDMATTKDILIRIEQDVDDQLFRQKNSGQKENQSMIRFQSILLLSAAITALIFTSCGADGNYTGREYMPDMAHSQAFEPYHEARKMTSFNGDTLPIFNGNHTHFKPVANTVPRGYMPYHLTDTPEGYEQSKALRNPYNGEQERLLAASIAAAKSGNKEKAKAAKSAYDNFLADAKEDYTTYCAVCHAGNGKGEGSIVKSGAYPTPRSYFDDDRLQLFEGQMFHSMHHGKNLMGSYSSQLSKEERWKVISYIRDMQAEHIAAANAKEFGGKPADYKNQALSAVINANTYTPGQPLGKLASLVDPNLEAVTFTKSALDAFADSAPKKGETIALNNVFFKSGSFDLRTESYIELDKLVSLMGRSKDMKIEVSGHTDSDGNPAANLKLSQNRAKAVYNYLSSQKVPQERMIFKGYGETKPVGDNSTDAGKAKNRRTEFKVL